MDTVKDKLEKYKEEADRNSKIESVNAEIKDISSKLSELNLDRKTKIGIIEAHLKSLKEAEMEYKKEKNFFVRLIKLGNSSQIANAKRKTEYLKSNIERTTKDLNKIEDEIKKLEAEIQNLKTSILNLETTKSIFKLDEKGRLIIDDKSLVKTNDKYLSEINKNSDSNILNDLMIVHVTNFFPQNHTILNNYAGNKVGTQIVDYEGVPLKVPTRVHRHTVHFTLNSVVHSTNDGAGTWGNEKYIVLEPFKYHTNDRICSISDADSYIYGNINFGDEAILLVRKEAYEELSDEIKNKYNIVLFEGSAEENVKKILDQFGYPTFNNSNGTNTGGHRQSLEYAIETALEAKNLAINYMLNINWDGESKLKLSEEEIVTLFNIISQNGQLSSCWGNLAYLDGVIKNGNDEQKNNLNKKVLKFIISTGLFKNSDGSYSFKSDDEIYDTAKELKTSKDFKIDLNFCEEIANIIIKHNQNKPPIIPLNTESKLSDLINFKNHQMAKSFVVKLESILNECVTKNEYSAANSYRFGLDYIANDGIILNVYVGDNLTNFIDRSYSRYKYELLDYEYVDNDKYTVFKLKIKGNSVQEVLSETTILVSLANFYANEKNNSKIYNQNMQNNLR